MKLEKQKAFIIKFVYITIIMGLGYVVIKFFLPLLMPFVIGLIISLVFRRPIDGLKDKLKIHRTLASVIVLILFYGIVLLLISFLGIKVFDYIKTILSGLPNLYKKTIEPAFREASNNLVLYFPEIEPFLYDFINNISQSIFSFVTTLSSTVVGAITGFASSLPSLLVKLLFTIVSSFLFTIDYYKISDFLMRQFSGKRKDFILKLKDNGVGAIGQFIKAYAMILSITCIEIAIGFWIIGIPNPILFGFLIAIVDVMPILGTGTVLLPWSLIGFIMGSNKIGLGMLILYVIITAVRQSIEPKIVGQQIGLHPVVTLLCMFVGVNLMGILGLLLLPVIATLLKKLNDDGVIQLFK
ncbi:MAG: sporulation integral membrane protein YtvI [Clostridiales bacterium]|jgi:sporulation integral membrane protein YtvI|nr:sporulation integral membrane protein YtvI [Clostridiales bacterium]